MFNSVSEIIDFDVHRELENLEIFLEETTPPNFESCQKYLQIGFRIILCLELTPETQFLHEIGWQLLSKVSQKEFKKLISEKLLVDLLAGDFSDRNIIVRSEGIQPIVNWIFKLLCEKDTSDNMAVKQHVTELVPNQTSFDLATLIHLIEAIQENPTQLGPENVRELFGSLIHYLSKIPTARESGAIKESKLDVIKIQEFVKNLRNKEPALYEYIIERCLKDLHKLITTDDQPSAYTSLVLEFVDSSMINAAVKWFLEEGNASDKSIKKCFNVLCGWLSNLDYAPSLNIWIIQILNILRVNQKYDLLLEMSEGVIENMFKKLVMPFYRSKLGVVVLCILSSVRHTPALFDKIANMIPKVLAELKRTEAPQKLTQMNPEPFKLLQNLVDLIFALLNIFPGYKEIEVLMEQFEKSYDYSMVLEVPPWNDTSQILIINSTNARVGLVNLGNTCYMNSVLQALVMTKQFSREILLSKNNATLFENIQKLLALLLHSKRPELNPRAVLAAAKPPDFVSGYQQDSSEFLGYLLEKLHEEEKTLNGKVELNTNLAIGLHRDVAMETVPKTLLNDCPSAQALLPKTLIQKTFDGKLSITYQCMSCGSKSSNTDSFRDLQLSFPEHSEIKTDYSVQKLLDIYCSSEKLDGDNQYFCDQCKCLSDGERSINILSPPKNLILTLKHFRYDQRHHTRAKLMNKVFHDELISLKILAPTAAEHVGVQYVLYAAVVHSGVSMDSGHYYTYAADQPNCWYKFNDNYVTKCSIEELHNLASPNTPYILFYQMVSLSETMDNCMEIDDVEFVEGTLVKKPCLIRSNIEGDGCAVIPLSAKIGNYQLPQLEELPAHLRAMVHNDNTSYKDEIKAESKRKLQNKRDPSKLFINTRNNRNRDSDNDEPPPNNCGGNSLDQVNRFIY